MWLCSNKTLLAWRVTDQNSPIAFLKLALYHVSDNQRTFIRINLLIFNNLKLIILIFDSLCHCFEGSINASSISRVTNLISGSRSETPVCGHSFTTGGLSLTTFVFLTNDAIYVEICFETLPIEISLFLWLFRVHN